MELGFPATLILLAAGLGVFGLSTWRARKKPDPLNIRMINYHYVQFFSLIFVLLMLAHVLTLIVGHPVTGRYL